jgi:hypothetical protein
MDFAFRRGAAPLQNEFFTANKQFISWLPVPDALPPDLETHGARLHALAAVMEKERAELLDWLGGVCGVDARSLPGWKKLEGYARAGHGVVLAVLDANASRLQIDPRTRAHRERISAEVDASSQKLAEAGAELLKIQREVDVELADAYGLTAAQLAVIDSEYPD